MQVVYSGLSAIRGGKKIMQKAIYQKQREDYIIVFKFGQNA